LSVPPVLPPFYPIGVQHGLVLGAVLFSIGVLGALTKRNAVAVLMSIELMLNGVNVTFVAFARHSQLADLTGQVFAIFVMTVAAADAAVGLAIMISLYRLRRSVQVDAATTLRG
jgi:NADH:ubiquinone oxidoreductase subunit K